MLLDITDLFMGLSYALDAVEAETVGATRGHGERVAYLASKMLKAHGCSDQELVDYAGVCMLHDNAVSESLREEFRLKNSAGSPDDVRQEGLTGRSGGKLGAHCILGEREIRRLPFRTDVGRIILHHHERADGKGPFGLTEDQTCLKGQILHLADSLDLGFDLRRLDRVGYGHLRRFLEEERGRLFSDCAVDLFNRALPYEDLARLRDCGQEACLRETVPVSVRSYTDGEVKGIATFFAGIVDYKSSITKAHSLGVAAKAEAMARHYGWSQDKVTRFYFAGAFHDIGKMLVPHDILEKPDKLDPQEFQTMATHAEATRKILSGIGGIGDITEWASNHHEKLDGTGYPRGLKADRLSVEDRLMACIDIYQALTEERPYKKGLPHEKAAGIMRSMAADGKIDAGIVEEMDRFFGQYQSREPLSSEKTGGDRAGKREPEGAGTEGTGLEKTGLKTRGPEGAAAEGADMGEGRLDWKCPVCGYLFEGEEPPETCPVCGAAGYRFEPV